MGQAGSREEGSAFWLGDWGSKADGEKPGTQRKLSIFPVSARSHLAFFPNVSPKQPTFETSFMRAEPQTPCGPHTSPGPAGRSGGAQSCAPPPPPPAASKPADSWPFLYSAVSRRDTVWEQRHREESPAGPAHRPFSAVKATAGAQTHKRSLSS